MDSILRPALTACSFSAMRISGWTTVMGLSCSSPGDMRKTMSSASPNAEYVVTFSPFAFFSVCFLIIVSETNILGLATRRWVSNDVSASSVTFTALIPLSNTLTPIAQ